jgi:diguanylate cyclase (GGDEF)-like protein
VEQLPDDFRLLGEGLQYFAECVMETKILAKALSKGELNVTLPSRENEMAAPLKALHSSLKHLTWQTQQVARGDYQQRVDFMGDFSKAFNMMIQQLDHQRKELLAEIERGIQKSQALAQSNGLFEAITGQISQWIIVMDKNTGVWLYVNRPPVNMLAEAIFEDQLRKWLIQYAHNVKENTQPHTTELELSHDGLIQVFSAAIYPLNWYEHNSIAFVLTDISSEKERFRALEDVAYRDTLTKVYNRHYGMKILREWLAKKKAFIICFVDMDNLKYVNDKFGHNEGDKYILCVTEVLQEFSPDAILCRLGGDEFMLLAQDWSIDAAEIKLEALRSRLTQYNNEPDVLYTHSMSYGVIEVDTFNAYSASELLSVADEKMYAYKRAHKAERQSSPV